MKKYILSGIVSMLVIGALIITAQSSVLKNESANGQGVFINADGSRSQFSFNARRNPNGKVTGQAILRNPSYRAGNGQNEHIKIDISCLTVIGNIAILGGMTKRKNNQAKAEAAYFAVKDNGNPGANEIFRGFFFDDHPSTDGDAQICQTLEPEILVLEPIAEGDIEVKVQ